MENHSRKKVLITGGAGYLGSFLVGELLKQEDTHVVVFSRDELKHFNLKMQLGDLSQRVDFVIGDVRDEDRLAEACNGVELVIHAAAMKQVGTCEDNPTECYKTNVLGTENVIHAARRSGVRQLIFVSTDKAVEPVSVYGNSKQAGERLVLKSNSPEFQASVIRFGNLIGSPGSIVDKLSKLNAGETITLYSQELTRFVDSLDNARQLIYAQMSRDFGGVIMIPKLRSVKVADLVSVCAPLIQVKFGGERGFEKIHEKLATKNELSRMCETEDFYLITQEALGQDGALDKFGALPVRLLAYDSETAEAFSTLEELRAGR
jgi:UDP-N-acetylglucosamine 4,6-dehydratase/5-epimerase